MRHWELIKKMTLREKAAFLTGKNEWESRSYAHLGIPEITFADGPSGVRRQKGDGDHLGLNPSMPATCFPSSSTMANSWDENLEEAIGEALAEEAIVEDVCVLLAPGLNLKRNPLCGRNFEYFSEDPYLSGKMAAAMVRGLQKKGTGACVKHFAVNSQEGRRMALNARLDEKTLRELYLTGFEIAVKEGQPRAVMSAYNEINGVYANENDFLLKKILRTEWGFKGFVVTDWGGDNDFAEGVKNGSNLQMPGCGLDSARELLRAVEAGSITEEEIDARVDELLDAALTIPAAAAEGKKELLSRQKELFEAHHRLAERAAAESCVLLKNEENILPLTAEKRIAIIGDFAFEPRYQGAGSSCVNAVRVDTVAECIMDTELTIAGMTRGYQRSGKEDKKREAEALELAQRADVIVYFLGLGEQDETEGYDRKNINIAQNQINLLHKIAKINSSVVAILNTGSVVHTWWRSECKAIVLAGLSGQAGALATLKVLTGEVNPGGKLTESWLRSYEDTPSFPNYPAKGHNLEYREGIYVGYRYFERNQIPVSFPFGYGLSYTSFAYQNLQVDENGITVTIENTGKYAGSEIVQMYVALSGSRTERPEKELKGFSRVQLAAGEQKEIYIPFDDKSFRFFCMETGKWEIEEGTYQILVGASSQDIRLTTEIVVKGTWKASGAEIETDLHQDSGQKENSMLLKEPVALQGERKILQRNDPLSEMLYARSFLARVIAQKMKGRIEKAEKEGQKPDLNMLFQYNMPFRAIAKMTQGMVSMRMVDGLLQIINGHFFTGIYVVITGFFSNRRENRDYEAVLKRNACMDRKEGEE